MTDRAHSRIRRHELMQRSGASNAQVTHWVTRQWLPSVNGLVGTGNHRSFTEDDVLAATLAVEAVHDFGPEAAGRVLRRIKAALQAKAAEGTE